MSGSLFCPRLLGFYDVTGTPKGCQRHCILGHPGGFFFFFSNKTKQWFYYRLCSQLISFYSCKLSAHYQFGDADWNITMETKPYIVVNIENHYNGGFEDIVV